MFKSIKIVIIVGALSISCSAFDLCAMRKIKEMFGKRDKAETPKPDSGSFKSKTDATLREMEGRGGADRDAAREIRALRAGGTATPFRDAEEAQLIKKESDIKVKKPSSSQQDTSKSDKSVKQSPEQAMKDKDGALSNKKNFEYLLRTEKEALSIAKKENINDPDILKHHEENIKKWEQKIIETNERIKQADAILKSENPEKKDMSKGKKAAIGAGLAGAGLIGAGTIGAGTIGAAALASEQSPSDQSGTAATEDKQAPKETEFEAVSLPE